MSRRLPMPDEMSHAMLIAVLMHHGGSMDLPAEAFASEATGTADGAFHAVEMRPQPDGTMRLSVVLRPAGDEEGVEFRG
ncbi:pRL2-19 [Streptomyces sp. NPDC057910]|uniref:pRL2-19 n=1 Tax=Streptomyces sp. NPDC057910 TaxID=3346278 RepID=UPI0036F11A92